MLSCLSAKVPHLRTIPAPRARCTENVPEHAPTLCRADHDSKEEEPTSLFQMSPCRLALEGKTMRTRRQVQDRASRAAEPLLLLQGEERQARGECRAASILRTNGPTRPC